MVAADCHQHSGPRLIAISADKTGAPSSAACISIAPCARRPIFLGFSFGDTGLRNRSSRRGISGGNITGVNFLAVEIASKRLELLIEVVPTVTVIGLLTNPNNPRTDVEIGQLQAAARIAGNKFSCSATD